MEGTKEIVHALLLSLTAGIGHVSETCEGEFVEGKDFQSSFKDLKRILKQDFYSSHRNVFFLLCEWNFMAKNLIPAFLHFVKESETEVAQLFCKCRR